MISGALAPASVDALVMGIFFCLDQITVFARHTNRSSSVGVNERDDFWIDEPPQHHLHDVHGGGVGHAHAIDER